MSDSELNHTFKPEGPRRPCRRIKSESAGSDLRARCNVVESGCWEWAGYRHNNYGRTYFLGKKMSAHRLSYEVFISPIPKGLHVLHKCDNPPCINPDHLFLGTDADNTRDKVSKGRQAKGPNHGFWCRGQNASFARLTNADVLAIRADQRPKAEIAKSYGITREHASRIFTRKAWSHL